MSGRTVSWPELQCVSGRVPAHAIEAAAARSAELRVPAERVLIADGACTEEDYWRAVSEATHISFDNLQATRRFDCPLDDTALLYAPAAGLLPLSIDGRRIYVVAPGDARRFFDYIAARPALRPFLRLTTARHLADYVRRVARHAVGKHAADDLEARHSTMSAMHQPANFGRVVIAIIAALAITATCAPAEILAALDITLLSVFLGWIALRLVGMLMQPPRERTQDPLPAAALPRYGIIVALYREASSVRRLVSALTALDYPREKLDIKLVLEEDDRETRAALAQIALGPQFEIVLAPAIGPRTKPKALNVALLRTTAAFVAVFDAEDRPEPDQLLKALAAFRSGPRKLACVQARLTIDNTADSWLAGLYTAEYAAQFDVFLPALAALSAPLPLGGTSNHFRADVLRKVGAWDAYNVTEDADLGMRLARFGYSCGMINSATYEEAPARIAPWLRQRTRWFKGWMQTYLVHMRQPVRLLRELGPFSFMIFQLSFGGNVLAALVHPFFFAAMIRALTSEGQIASADDFSLAMTGLFGTAAALGYIASALLNGVGLVRRKLFGTLWVVALTPLHWLLLSAAAWRALYQLVRDPYRWEKTEHGLARTSRRKRHIMETLSQLEREVRGNA